MIYFSSFNQKLYSATGHTMVRSFLEKQPEDHLCVFTEGDIQLDQYASNIKYISLDDNTFISDWLSNNKEIIPKVFGGSFECKCKTIKRPNHMTSHSPSCPAGGMRRRAAHWIKKVGAWQRAAEMYQTEPCTWIDCDTMFLKQMPQGVLLNYLKDCCVRFHYGKRRHQVQSGIETGVVLFDMPSGADKIIQEVCKRLDTKELFINEKRWDDAWMLTVVVRDLGLLHTGDLTPTLVTGHPINSGPLSKYITHNKGTHWRNHGING